MKGVQACNVSGGTRTDLAAKVNTGQIGKWSVARRVIDRSDHAVVAQRRVADVRVASERRREQVVRYGHLLVGGRLGQPRAAAADRVEFFVVVADQVDLRRTRDGGVG